MKYAEKLSRANLKKKKVQLNFADGYSYIIKNIDLGFCNMNELRFTQTILRIRFLL